MLDLRCKFVNFGAEREREIQGVQEASGANPSTLSRFIGVHRFGEPGSFFRSRVDGFAPQIQALKRVLADLRRNSMWVHQFGEPGSFFAPKMTDLNLESSISS